jgi:GNAT superfamily N-acetyltransferase
MKLDELNLLVDMRMEVLRAVFELASDYDMSALAEANRVYYEKAISDGYHVALGAFYGDEFVACAGLCLYQQLPSPDDLRGTCACLMNVYTRPQFRGKGIAGFLTEQLISCAKERGVDRIFLETTPAGRSVYEALGFSDIDGHMEKRLYCNDIL